MTALNQLIGELLVRHNCVIVPAFGGFVAKATPAKIDFQKGIMLPPSKSLLFNRQLINNDGLLITELASRLGSSYSEAESLLKETVLKWKKQLNGGERIELEKVGYLYFDHERNICFEQDRFFNLLMESFGLGKVQFMAESKVIEATVQKPDVVNDLIVEEKEETKIVQLNTEIEIVEEIVEEDKTIKVVQRRPVWKYIAAACLLPIAFYSFWIPMKTDVLESGIISIKDFNPFYSSSEGSYKEQRLIAKPEPIPSTNSLENKIEELPEGVNSYSYKIDQSQYVLVKLDKTSKQELNTYPVSTNNVEPIQANSMNYIVGCFSSESNANNLVAKLKANGLNARIVDVQNGLHRVTAGSAISIEALGQIQSTADALGFKGWVLK